jgi:hypothetical protein
MALVHPNSCECTKSELDLFEVPPTQSSVEHGYWEQKGLTSSLTDQGPYEFAVSGAGDEYIDLANTYLFVEAQIVAEIFTESRQSENQITTKSRRVRPNGRCRHL